MPSEDLHFMDQLEDLGKPTVAKKAWMEDVDLILATAESLDEIEKEALASGRCALDLETTGLNQRAFPNDQGRLITQDKIVGFCFAATVKRAYYVPVRHRELGAHANVPVRLVVDLINRLQSKGVVFIFHNAKFDTKFLACEPAGAAGEWDDPAKWEDTLAMAYLRNSRERQKGLKYLSKKSPDDEYPGLGREMIELGDLYLKEKGKKIDKDFSLLDPTWEPVVWYAAADALNTLALYELLRPVIMEQDKFGRTQKTVYTIEKVCLIATQWMEQCRIYIDRKKLTHLIQTGQQEWWDSIQDVYSAVSATLDRDIRPPWLHTMAETFDPQVVSPGYMEVREQAMRASPPDTRPVIPKSVPTLLDPKIRETVKFSPAYDVTIPAQLGMMLRELGVRGLKATEKSGQVQTSKDVLEEVIGKAGDQYPWMKQVRRFREVAKALGDVLTKLYRDTEPKERSPDGCVWANFNGLKTDTGRFSTPGPSDKSKFHGQVDWNVQSTKAHYYDPKDPPPECVYRQREVIAARLGYLFFAIDYSGVELRIVTNLSGEPKWVQAFFECSSCGKEFERDSLPPAFCPDCGSDKIGDLHTLTAMGIFPDADPKGDPKVFKLRRQVGKIVNFLLCYGGSGIAVQRSTGCDKEEGWRIKNQFDKTYRGLLRWWKSQHKLAKKQKYVTTVFGRRYPVPDIDHEFGKFRSKAERNSVNGPVQGSSADIMKLAMGLLYREFKKRGWIKRGPGLPDLVLMVITIHDELAFEVHESIVDECIPVIEKIMCEDTIKNLGWLIKLKVDIEFGYGENNNWTVPYNLTEMAWNQGGGDWTSELVKFFPHYYANYLKCGGKPVEDVKFEPPSEDESGKPSEPLPPRPSPDSTEASPPTEQPSTQPPPAPVPTQSATPLKASPEPEPERLGSGFVFRISRARMTPDVAERLARVVSKCIGRGVDILRILDDQEEDLLGGPVKVAYEEFRVIAAYEGL
jgi:DNA polymerase I-like protein with 3'-5' exonuclease and polymerase domains